MRQRVRYHICRRSCWFKFIWESLLKFKRTREEEQHGQRIADTRRVADERHICVADHVVSSNVFRLEPQQQLRCGAIFSTSVVTSETIVVVMGWIDTSDYHTFQINSNIINNIVINNNVVVQEIVCETTKTRLSSCFVQQQQQEDREIGFCRSKACFIFGRKCCIETFYP